MVLLQSSSCPSPTPQLQHPELPTRLDCTSGHCSSQSCLGSPSWSHLPRYSTVTSVKSFLPVVIPRQSSIRETWPSTAWPCCEPVPPREGQLVEGRFSCQQCLTRSRCFMFVKSSVQLGVLFYRWSRYSVSRSYVQQLTNERALHASLCAWCLGDSGEQDRHGSYLCGTSQSLQRDRLETKQSVNKLNN